MKKIKDIIKDVAVLEFIGSDDVIVNEIVFDSRLIQKDDLFVAQRGVSVDGHDYIDTVVQRGASVVVCEELPSNIDSNVLYVKVENSNVAMALIASNYYGNPSSKLKLVGVTGTNGKTTIATLLYDLFEDSNEKVGLLSTVKVMVDKVAYKATHTTPDSVSINRYLHQMVEAGVSYCFMEVSSHGIHQKRTEGLHFAGGVFTNLSHDHLDYHKTFAEYRDVKKSFFDGLSKSAFALSNVDDKNGVVMLQNTKAKKVSYALKSMADYKVKILENQMSGMLLSINNTEVWVKLIGSFNAYNLLAIYAVAEKLGHDKDEILRLMSTLESVSGRFQYFISKGGLTVIVDYAHTPDALKNVLQTVRDIRFDNQKIHTVVGCGGDRDKTKRPLMASIASVLSDQVVLTSDNPRTEDPQVILSEMESGIESENEIKVLSILDREQAIKTAVKLASKGDVILIAGKGHETYQEVNGVRSEFDDYKKAQEIINQLGK